MFSKKTLGLVGLISLVLLTRFVPLDWGGGYFFHPDENNLARALISLQENHNPNFFAYGQLPLFFARGGLALFSFLTNQPVIKFSQAVLSLRLVSATAGALSIFFVWQLANTVFPSPSARLTTGLTATTAGLIQASHFGTPDNLLVLFNLVSLLGAVKFYQTQQRSWLLTSFAFVGLAAGTKLSGFIFLANPVLALLFSLPRASWRRLLKLSLIGGILCLTLATFTSPYHLLNWPQAKKQLSYEIKIASGHQPIFYTRQFEQTTPYLFPLVKVLPFLLGSPLLLLAGLGLTKIRLFPRELIIISLSALIYFFYFGQLFVKWSRFFLPIVPIFSLWAVFYLRNLVIGKQQILFSLACLPGLLFWGLIYWPADIRLTASDWLNRNLPTEAAVLTESYNPALLPLSTTTTSSQAKIATFNFYELNNQINRNTLAEKLSQADYFIIPNRRVFANHQRLEEKYPHITQFYRRLFSGRLGFTKIKQFNPPFPFSWDEKAEETWSVFDHPTIRVYQKTTSFSVEEYRQRLWQ